MSDARINTLLPNQPIKETNTPTAAQEPSESNALPEKDGTAKILGAYNVIEDYVNVPKPGMN